jgi:hypothetical protein
MRYVGDVDVERADVLVPAAKKRGAKIAQAVEWLTRALNDLEWHESAGLKKLAWAEGGFSEATIKRAAQDLGVEHEQMRFPRTTHWRLRDANESQRDLGGESGSEPPQSAQGTPTELSRLWRRSKT